MNPQTDPLILQKLEAFSQRRRKLIIRRGIYSAVATLLIGMMLVAMIDALVQLPDMARWILSGAAYLAVLIVEWRTCLRLLMITPGPRELARLVEHAEPRLREDLLSAVELGESKPGAVFDSEQFRGLVQSDVAARMEKIDVERLLPSQLLRRHAWLAAGFAAVCVVTIALTGLQFGTALIRALLPTANIARISRVKIQIVEPTPAEMRVPQGDTLPLVIELTGQKANKAFLETSTPSGGRQTVQMSPLGHDRFSATIQVGRENVRYRARAGDGETVWNRLEALARPAVVEFQKSYTFPVYAKLEPKVVKEENGDVAALEGSQVELRLHTNQKVKDAELRIEQGKTNTVVPLVADGDELVAKVPITASGIYRVHLVGAESGFENKFSPEYELRAEPDLVPQVELETPKQDLILPSNEIVEVVGSASDDFALAKVSQMVKINEGGWKETPLPTDKGPQSRVERRWDLFEQGVKPGDLVTMKLVATDMKGNKAESRPLQVTITAAGFESKRLSALAGQRRLYELLKAQQDRAERLAKQTSEVRKQFERLGDSDPARIQVLSPVIAGQQEFVLKAGETMTQFRETMTEAMAGHQTGDLSLIGNALVRSQAIMIQNAQRVMEAVAANPALPVARDFLNNAADLTHRTEQKIRQAMEVQRVFLTAEELDVFQENIQVVAQEQARLLTLAHRSGTDAEKWTPVANRLRVVLAELRGLEELAGAMIAHGAQGVPDQMKNVQKLLNKRRTNLETALGGKPGAELLAPTMDLSNALSEVSRNLNDVRRNFRNLPIDRMRDLSRDTEAIYSNFDSLKQEIEKIHRNERIPVEVSNDLLNSRWLGRLAIFKGIGDVEEWRPNGDSVFVNDVRLVTRVIEAFRDKFPGKPDKEFTKQLQAIDRSFRVLECGHDLAAMVEGVRHLAVAERWEIYNPKARTANVRDWGWAGERLRSMPDELGRALNFDERRPLMQEAQKILWQGAQQPFAQGIRREMDERFNASRDPISVRDDVAEMADYLQRALDLFREPMAEARKALSALTPTLAETMKQLAKKTEQLKEQTTNQAQQAHEKLPEEAKTDAKQVLAEQQRLNEKIDALKDALRADANRQNILNSEGRERARDADDALAMLKEPPVRAEEALSLAAKSDKTPLQEQALIQAAEQQQKLVKALEQMAEHYDALEQGKAEETRVAMRETEKENGIKQQLDEQFAKAEELAKMSQKTPEELLAQLEKALPQNPQMQQELSAISQNTLKSAENQLKQATSQENAIAQSVQKLAADEKMQAAIKPTTPQALPADGANAANSPPQNPANPANPPSPNAQPQPASQQASTPPGNPVTPSPADPNAMPPQSPPVAPPANSMLTQAAQQQKSIGDAAGMAASDISRAGRHEERMQNKIAGEQLQKLGSALQQTAEQKIPNAQDALQKAQQAAEAQGAVDDASRDLQKALGQLAATTNPGEQSTPEQGKSPSSATAEALPLPPGMSAPPLPAAPTGQPMAQANPKTPDTSEPASASQAPATPASAQTGNAPGSAPQAGQPSSKGTAAAPSAPAAPTMAEALSPFPTQPGETPPATPAGEMAGGPASAQEQMWMARALDALDAALNAPASAQGQNAQAGQQQQQPQQQQGKPDGKPQNAQASGNQSQSQQSSAGQQNPGNKPAPQSNSMAQAQSALAQAAQAAAAQARQERNAEANAPGQSGKPQPGAMQAASRNGVQSGDDTGPRGALPDAKNRAGDWGKLPKQMAEQLTQGQREEIAGEYRNQVETYYRAIAEKSKK